MAQQQELQRDLGLWSIIAISMGAMIGSGIFILPGLAMAEAGPSVILAFVLAAVLVVPAAISIAELGTAMPEAGGDYIFIERGMGPGAGTIAGLGTWLMLMFKGALALVGGMFYLKAVMTLPSVEAVAVVIGTILIAVNVFGVKQTGNLQTIMVIVMVLILGVFVSVSLIQVENQHFEGFFDEGTGGLLAATAMVLVSYAGVTKVAAVAEEIEDPGRNLPLGLLLSLGFTTLLYALIVFVLVGIVDGEHLAGSNVPMVDAVEPFFGTIGVVLIVVAAMLALISTANAGVLTASRYPFALSRDKLLPEFFGKVHDDLHTPVTAILITGGAMLAIIIFLPVEDIAKTAGSFQIIVYILVNVALIAFRVTDPVWYEPEFKAPLYPWIPLFGIVSGLAILTQMDLMPLIGGVGIIVLGSAWYMYYGKQRVEREGILGEALATTIDVEAPPERAYRVVVPIADHNNLRGLIRTAAASASPHANAELIGVNVVTVPDQTSLAQEVSSEVERMEKQKAILEEAVDIAAEFGMTMRTHPIVGRDISDAILHVIEEEEADEVILGWKGKRNKRDHILGSIIDPVVEQARCEVTLAKIKHENVGNTVAFVTDGPYAKVTIIRAAELVSRDEEATLTLSTIAQPDGESSEEELIEQRRQLIKGVVDQIELIDIGDYTIDVVIADDIEEALVEKAKGFQTVCIGATRSKTVERVLFGTIPETVGEHADGNVIIVQGEDLSRRSLWTVLKSWWNS